MIGKQQKTLQHIWLKGSWFGKPSLCNFWLQTFNYKNTIMKTISSIQNAVYKIKWVLRSTSKILQKTYSNELRHKQWKTKKKGQSSVLRQNFDACAMMALETIVNQIRNHCRLTELVFLKMLSLRKGGNLIYKPLDTIQKNFINLWNIPLSIFKKLSRFEH